MTRSVLRLCLVLGLAMISLAIASVTCAADWYVAPDGRPNNQGTLDFPWTLAQLWTAHTKIAPGDTVWIKAGTYRHPDRSLNSPGFVVRLQGTEREAHSRARNAGHRVTVDGGLSVVAPSDYLWIWDVEILVSENFTMSRESTNRDRIPKATEDLGVG